MDAILIRHAWSAMTAGLCYGRTDLELVSPMDPESSAIVEKFVAYTPHRLLVSSLRHNRPTAEVMTQATQLPAIEINTQLMELDFGTWEGCQWDEISRAEIDHWAHDLVHGDPHGGESAADLLTCVTTWAKITIAMSTSCIWTVTYAGCMRALTAYWLQRPSIEIL